MTRVVIAPAVQVATGGRTFFLERGAVVPEGVALEVLDRLTAEGMLAEPEPEPEGVADSESKPEVEAKPRTSRK